METLLPGLCHVPKLPKFSREDASKVASYIISPAPDLLTLDLARMAAGNQTVIFHFQTQPGFLRLIQMCSQMRIYATLMISSTLILVHNT